MAWYTILTDALGKGQPLHTSESLSLCDTSLGIPGILKILNLFLREFSLLALVTKTTLSIKRRAN
jgi:hypothetical protein